MSATSKINILMVDDEPGKLLTYEVILRELGENLIKANSGKEALELLLKNDVAVVLTDVKMPEMSGFELADMIHQHPRFQQIPIIFISALLVTDLDRLKGYQAGAVDYVSVPIVPELLQAKVSIFAELHRRAQQLETLNGELRRLSNSLIAAQDQERRRIARDLHDSLGQELAAAKMAVDGILLADHLTDSISKLAATEASVMLDRAIQQLRTVSHLLHPPLLDEVGLVSALRWFVEGLTKRSGIVTFLDVQPAEFPRLAPALETAIFRIIQEALTNVFRHSGARNGWVTLERQDGQLVITIRDDGKGISKGVADFKSRSIGVGLGGMRQRVKEFGGVLRLENTSPGTLLEITIPSSSLVYAEPTVVPLLKDTLPDKAVEVVAITGPISALPAAVNNP
ncbi:MAG: sensor histidine kinase [Candidatus Sulfotelmatobacter sp.]|nr:sensor histidine kinase [Candidatus Sulfotelmatobacter sp.]